MQEAQACREEAERAAAAKTGALEEALAQAKGVATAEAERARERARREAAERLAEVRGLYRHACALGPCHSTTRLLNAGMLLAWRSRTGLWLHQ